MVGNLRLSSRRKTSARDTGRTLKLKKKIIKNFISLAIEDLESNYCQFTVITGVIQLYNIE
jgi:hypothetical protein